MRTYLLEREQWLPKPVDEVFLFFSRPENLQIITPPWLDFRMGQTLEALAVGSLIRYRLRWHKVPIRWTTEIRGWSPPHGFVDRAVSSPYALRNHEHWCMTGARRCGIGIGTRCPSRGLGVGSLDAGEAGCRGDF